MIWNLDGNLDRRALGIGGGGIWFVLWFGRRATAGDGAVGTWAWLASSKSTTSQDLTTLPTAFILELNRFHNVAILVFKLDKRIPSLFSLHVYVLAKKQKLKRPKVSLEVRKSVMEYKQRDKICK